MSEAMRDYTVLYNTRSSLWRAHHSASRDVRDQHIGRVLDCAMVAALESVACRVGTQERAGLSEERFSVRRLRLFGGEELVDLHHKPGQRMEPIEPRVREHEASHDGRPCGAGTWLPAGGWPRRVPVRPWICWRGWPPSVSFGVNRPRKRRAGDGTPGGRPLPSEGLMRDCSVVTERRDPRKMPARPIEQVRERVIDSLSEHFARDNLSLDELETRMTRVYAASTPQEVEALLAGLPVLN